MSLFKTRTFWQIQSDPDEVFDQNSLYLTRLHTESDYIITGSHSGVLRIFKPSTEVSDNNLLPYKATDLLIEKTLPTNILQIGSGRLVSGSTKCQLAVLHPRSLSVYSLTTKEGATDHGNQNMLELLYEHKFRRFAANFVLGPFGGGQNRDFSCVQSLDGLLIFFEQESFAFCCFLPDFLLPSPMVFIKKSDCFVMGSSSWNLLGFKYKQLSEAGLNSVESADSGKKVAHDWLYNLGEGILEIEVVEDISNNETNIMVLGERNLICITANGRLKYMKKLEFSPIAFTNYVLDEGTMTMVISETSNVLIYQNTSLKWSAQLEVLPVSIKRALLKNISGVIVLLSEEGLLECCYLGTEPSLFVAPPLSSQELDFDKAGFELATLQKIIKNSYSNDMKVTNASAERELTITINLTPHEDFCIVNIDVVAQALFEEVQIVAHVKRPLKVDPPVHFFQNLSEKIVMQSKVYLSEPGLVGSLQIQIVASFISNLGVPRTVSKKALLPLTLALQNCTASKDLPFKINLTVDQSTSGLSQIFPEISSDQSCSSLGFFTHDGNKATVLLAKSLDRFRIQSDSLPVLNLLLEQLIYRLKKSKSSIKLTSSIPSQEAIVYIHNHFNSRQKYNSLQEELGQLSGQFRLIQKRLIAKFKVKNPTSLTNLELLLNDTLSEITRVTQHFQEEQLNLFKTQNELGCTLEVITNCLSLQEGNVELVESAFSPYVYDLEKQNWEDVMDASLCFLLRTLLPKCETDKLRAAHASVDEVKDVSKVEKHFLLVLDRISNTELSLAEDTEDKEAIIEKKPLAIGSKLGEASSRLLSARRNRIEMGAHQ